MGTCKYREKQDTIFIMRKDSYWFKYVSCPQFFRVRMGVKEKFLANVGVLVAMLLK